MFIKYILCLIFSLHSLADINLNQIKKSEEKNRLIELGKVIKIVGDATIIDEKNRIPTKIVHHQNIYNDSSIFCEKNCYLTIDLNNEYSYLKIGQTTSIFIVKKNDEIHLKLNQGFIKTLFKASQSLEKLKIETKNSITELKNNKTLVVYSPLVKKTSVINYKGNAIFASLHSISEPPVNLPPNHYSYVSRKMLSPATKEKLSEKRKERLLKVFSVDSSI